MYIKQMVKVCTLLIFQSLWEKSLEMGWFMCSKPLFLFGGGRKGGSLLSLAAPLYFDLLWPHSTDGSPGGRMLAMRCTGIEPTTVHAPDALTTRSSAFFDCIRVRSSSGWTVTQRSGKSFRSRNSASAHHPWSKGGVVTKTSWPSITLFRRCQRAAASFLWSSVLAGWTTQTRSSRLTWDFQAMHLLSRNDSVWSRGRVSCCHPLTKGDRFAHVSIRLKVSSGIREKPKKSTKTIKEVNYL